MTGVPNIRSTACGDRLLYGFYPNPTKEMEERVKQTTNETSQEKLDEGEGRFYYAVLGPNNVSAGWDKLLERQGFKCVRSVLNSSHHSGEPMKFYLKVG